MPLPQQKYLTVNGDRTIAYSDSGNPNGDTVVLFLHGLFGIGNASRPAPVMLEKGMHFIAPTLPGFGETSSPSPSSTFVSCLTEDMTALITHLHPDTTNLKLYIGGGSYGTAAAQILYGASYDVFPLGRKIAGLLLLAAFSPFRLDPNYTKSLVMNSYIAVGPPAYKTPFNLIPRLLSYVIKWKLGSQGSAEKFMRTLLFDKMDEAERGRLTQWCKDRDMTLEQLIAEWSEAMLKSVEKTWNGFLGVAKVLHGDWGFTFPLDDEHSRSHVLIVSASQDDLGKGMADFLVANYKNSTSKVVEGGHIGSLVYLDDIWREFLV